MAEDRIDSIIDFGSIQKEIDKLNGLTKDLATSLKNIPKVKVQIEGAADAKELSIANLKLQQETKAVINLINQRFAADAKVITLQTDYAKATAQSRLEIQKQNAELKTQAQLQVANTGSLERARATIKSLRAEQEGLNLNTKEGQDRNAALITSIDKYNNFIKKNSDALAQQKINVGNYSGAINVLQKSLENVSNSIAKNTAAGKGGSDATKKLVQEQRILNDLLKSQAAGFAKGALEVRANEKALLDLSRAGLENTETFKKLASATGDLKDSLADIKARTKALGSDTFAFDAAVQGAQTLAGVYGVAQGAAALFGKENEEVAKVLIKLQAVQTIITGLQQVQNSLQKESALILGIQALREKALLGIQTLRNFVLRGTITATAANTAVTAAGTTATLANTVATRVATVATIGFRAALIATGIGAILILLTAAASAMGAFGGATKDATESIDAFNNRLAFNKNLLESAIDVLQFSGKIQAEQAKQRGANEVQLSKLEINNLLKQRDVFLQNAKLRQQEFDKEIAKTKGFNSEKSTALLKEIAENKSAADEIRKEVVIKEEQEKTKIAVKGFADRRKAKEDAEKKEKTDAENARKEALRIAEADRKAAFEIFVDSAQERADLAKKDSENESLPLQERLNRLIDFNGEMQSILLAQKDFDLENTKLTETEKLKIVNKLGIDTNKLIEEFTDRRNNILKTSRQNDIKKFEDSIENLKKESEKLLDNVLFGIDQTKNEELLQAAKDFNSGKIKTEEDYIKRKKEINDKADEAEFSAKIDHELKMLFIQKAAGKDVEQQIKNLQQLKKQYDEKEIADEEAKANKIIDINTRIKNAKKDLLKEGYETFISFVNASFEKEVLNLDESKRLLDEETKRKINAIQQLGLTEVERTKQISIVEKNAAFQTEQIEKRKREIAVQRARFEKAQSIAAIIQGTSVAVINALGAKPYGPQNLFLAGLVGAIGALQLARAIAQPIPKYKGGRGFGKKEIAEVGDGFKNEYILRESGNIEKTPSVPTLTQLMPRDIVFKDQNALAMAMINSANPYHKVMQQAQPSYIKSLDKEILGELKEIRKRSGISIHNNLAIESTAYYQNAIKN